MPKDLQTLKLARKSRTYFFDIAKTDGRDLYLRISCSEKTRTGFNHHRLFIFEEDLAAFATALQKSVKEVDALRQR